jgi:hypothetical protein
MMQDILGCSLPVETLVVLLDNLECSTAKKVDRLLCYLMTRLFRMVLSLQKGWQWELVCSHGG